MTIVQTHCLRVAVITGTDSPSVLRQMTLAAPYSDVIELRLDYWKNLEISAIREIKNASPLPIILTLRKYSQGGRCFFPEERRLLWLLALAELHPDYIDLEYDVPAIWISHFHRQFPGIQIIGSYHDFNGTPADLAELWKTLHNPLFAVTKVALFARNLSDTLRFLIFLKTISRKHRVAGIAMGEYGEISRILSPIVGGSFSYAYVDFESPAAPGQLSISTLTEIYRLPALNQDTAVYALLGDPVSQSPGHVIHNRAFAHLRRNAVYVKCRVAPEQLAQVMPLLRQLPFSGFSVTIPHKETITAWVDDFFAEAAALRIVNTIKCVNQRYQGFNTDSAGSASVLETQTSLYAKRCLILGAGGSAKAIAYMLIAKKAEVTVCNRTLSRALSFTEKFGAKALDFNALFSSNDFPYDIIINTLPPAAFAEQCGNWPIPAAPSPQAIAMDIILKPLETLFIQSARLAGWRCITGDHLFIAQAHRQLEILIQPGH